MRIGDGGLGFKYGCTRDFESPSFTLRISTPRHTNVVGGRWFFRKLDSGIAAR